MAETFNPILRETTVPTEETGLFGKKTTRKQDPVFAPIPSTAVVVQRSGGGGDDGQDLFTLLDDQPGMSVARLDPTSRVYRIDLGDKALVWDLAAPSNDADLGFTAKLVTVLGVTDPTTVARLGVRDVRGHLRGPLTALVRAQAGRFPIGAGIEAAAAVVAELQQCAFDCGITVRWAHSVVEPDAWSAERVESRQEKEHEHELTKAQNAYDQEHDRLVAEREGEALKHQRLLEEQRDAFKAERERAEHEHDVAKQRLDEARQLELDQLRADREQANLEHQATLEAKREAFKAERSQAERGLARQRQEFEEQTEQAKRKHAIEREQEEAKHEAQLAAIREGTEIEHQKAADLRRREQRQLALAEASRLNDEISRHPGKMMGYLLALEDSEAVREALKVSQERQRVAWDRFKDLQKLNILSEEELKGLAISLMNDPAGGAFGVDTTDPASAPPTE